MSECTGQIEVELVGDAFSTLEVGKGSVIVLMVDGILGMEQRELIKAAWSNAVANGTPFIMDKGMRLGSIKLLHE